MRALGLPPGPSLPAAAQAVLWGLRFPAFTQRAHSRYGATFTARIGDLQPSVVTTDRDAIRRLLTGDPLLKRHANDQLRPLFGQRSLVVLEPAEHLRRRRLLLPPFHGERVRAHEDLIARLAFEQLEHWHPGDMVRILPAARKLTLEVILQSLLGVSDHAIGEELRGIFDAMIGLPGSAIAGYFPKLGTRSSWNVPAQRFWRLRDALDATLAAQINLTRDSPRLAERGDILATLVQARDEQGRRLDDTDLRDELKTLITAGHETTASAITWGVELLAHAPRVRERAREAIRSGETEYLDALVKEVLRLRPPVPIGATRRMLEPFAIGPFTIPPGTPILVNAHGLQRDAVVYPHPNELRVERFIGRPPDAYRFLPFGGGAHRCIGAALAQLEIRIVLSAIIARFDLTPLGPPATAVRRGITLVPRNGAYVRLGAPPRRATP